MEKENAPDEMAKDLPIFVKWMDFLKWLLVTTEKFPKRTRFTLADRLVHLSLDVVEDIIEARYTKNKTFILQRENLKIEKMRILLRICYETKILPHAAYKHAMYGLNEAGKMFGGWIKQQQERKQETPR